MDESKCCHNKQSLLDVADGLITVQYEFENVLSKLNRTVLSFQRLLDEKDTKPGSQGSVDDITDRILDSKLEDKVRQRLFGEKLASEEWCKMGVKVNSNDSNENNDKHNDFSWSTCDYWSLPLWLQDNNYILKGYRPQLPSYLLCSQSIFRIHTETINIWTHLLGCLLFIILAVHTALNSFTLEDKLILTPFFIGAILCLWFSASFHTVHCHSPSVSQMFGRLDYCGITLLITGSFVPWLYYSFFCSCGLKLLYLSGVLTLGVCATVVSLSETFSQPHYRPLRATVFIIFGLSGLIPGIHYILLDGWDSFLEFGRTLLITAVLYIAGAVIYAVRVPERIFPGKCDILFQSHQIFHVLVVIATLIDYLGIVKVVSFVQLARAEPEFCQQRQHFFYKHKDILF